MLECPPTYFCVPVNQRLTNESRRISQYSERETHQRFVVEYS
jgi:hypothetical protein